MIIKPGQLTLPLDSTDVFGRSGPLVLEVGFGDGRYLAHLSHEHPDWNLFGVEVSMGSIWRAYRRMKREHISNVRLYHGDARFIFRDILPPRAVRAIYVNFPDPWPRRRNLENRLLQEPFFELASTRLEEEGILSLTTDHEDYFHFAITEANKTGLYQVEKGTPPEATLHTKYALKWRDQDKKIYHVLFRKTGEASFQPGIIQTVEMQHAVLTGDLESIGSFSKHVRAFDGGHVIVLDAFRELSSDGLLFKVIVEETDLRQEVLIQAWQKKDGIYVGLQPFGDPLATKGVKEAVWAVAEWLVDQGLQLKESWI